MTERGTVLQVMEAFRGHTNVTYLILKLAGEVMDSQSPYLDVSGQLFASLRLKNSQSRHQIGAVVLRLEIQLGIIRLSYSFLLGYFRCRD